MHLPRRYRSVVVAAALAVSFQSPAFADTSDTAAGRWQGKIQVPGNPLEVFVDLGENDGDWVGEIDIPVQGLANFPLGNIAIDGRSARFAITGVPGDPTFHGELDAAGNVLEGKFTQGPANLPFRLERVGEAELEEATEAPPIPSDAAARFEGRWQGELAIPGRALRLVLNLAADADAGLVATLDSPDQGQSDLPVSKLSVEGDRLRAELTYLGAAFEGELDAAGTALSGTWSQGGGSMPLVLDKEGGAAGGNAADAAFPEAEPESVDIPEQALEILDRHLQALVDDQEIVGGELLVIKNRRTVLRKAYGWQDQGSEKALEPGAVYCVRSMTKPFVGTAIRMLMDEGKLELDTPVHEILPSFAEGEARKITVGHLLGHTGGFPFTTLAKGLDQYADLADVAAEAAGTELLFEPGERFEYSDAGSDTLGAVVAAVSGMPLEDFLAERVLGPLGMDDTYTLLGELEGDRKDAVMGRIPAAYSGGTGAWSAHWSPSDGPLFPLFLGSQSLYSTTTDYARFLALWMDGGEHGQERLISADGVKQALEPGHAIGNDYFDGLQTTYGQQWIVHAEEGADRPTVFGHDGSDGTHAFAWPEEDLMVLYFTQSRGTISGLGLANLARRVLVDQDLEHASLAARTADPDMMQEAAGIYWDEDVEDAYYVVNPRGARLIVERPGRTELVMKPGDIPGRFVHEARSDIWVEFVRAEGEGGAEDGEAGEIEAMRTFFGSTTELDPRHVPDPELPSVEAVIEKVRKAHRVDRLAELGAVRVEGTLTIESRGMEGTLSRLFDVERSRSEIRMAGAEEQVVVVGGEAFSHTSTTGFTELEGRLEVQTLLDRPAVLYGDWTEHYLSVEVLRRVSLDDRPALMVRVVPEGAQGSTFFVDEESGRIVRSDALVLLPGLGVVGVSNHFEDFREVGGLILPFRTESQFATPFLGKVVVTVEKAEVGVELDENSFVLPGQG